MSFAQIAAEHYEYRRLLYTAAANGDWAKLGALKWLYQACIPHAYDENNIMPAEPHAACECTTNDEWCAFYHSVLAPRTCIKSFSNTWELSGALYGATRVGHRGLARLLTRRILTQSGHIPKFAIVAGARIPSLFRILCRRLSTGCGMTSMLLAVLRQNCARSVRIYLAVAQRRQPELLVRLCVSRVAHLLASPCLTCAVAARSHVPA